MEVRRNAKLLALLVLLLALCACGKSAEEVNGLILTTGDETGTYYQFGNLLAQKINTATTTFVATVTSEGSGQNLEALAKHEAQFAFTQYDAMLFARQGREAFRENGPIESFSVIAALYPEAVHIVTLDPAIDSVADLAGKRVSVGPAGSGGHSNAVDILDACGMTEKDIQAFSYSFRESVDGLLGGTLDAAFLVAGAPVGAVASLAEERQIYLISLDEACIEKLIAKGPAYSRAVIPADAYGTAEDCSTVAVDAVIVADNGVSETEAYDFIRGIYDNLEALEKESPYAEYLSLALAASVADAPYHPGAAKYFAEHGFSVPAE